MGCCCAKEAAVVTTQSGDQQGISPKGSTATTSPADGVAALSGSASNSEKDAASNRKSSRLGKWRGGKKKGKKAPPAPEGAIPISKSEAPPPGWGGTPEVEDVTEETEERQSGPRALKNIPGGNGYVSGTRKDQEISDGVMDRIRGLEDAGLQTKRKMGLKMLTPRIITDVKETWDKEGNITRYMTHYIEEPDGKKHTKKETVYIAAGDPDPLAAEPAAVAE